ncbi:MAG: trypsin-like peptidase domain-containing protein [Lachnospiraceae bacterium]|nr:trypsin-like peptidase domain-containing protein [Lachnospiraceae bacterium]
MDDKDFYFGFDTEDKDKQTAEPEAVKEAEDTVSAATEPEDKEQEQPKQPEVPEQGAQREQKPMPSYYDYYQAGYYNNPQATGSGNASGSGRKGNSFMGPFVAVLTMLLVIGSIFGLSKLLNKNDPDDLAESTLSGEVAKNEPTDAAPNKENTTTAPTSVLTRSDINTTKNVNATLLDVSPIVDEVMPSVVAVTNKTIYTTSFSRYFGSGQQEMKGAGSGVIIGKNDDELLIVSNAHVVTPENYNYASVTSSEISVKFVNDKEIPAYVKGTDEERDLAVIAVKLSDIDEETMKAIKIAMVGDSDKLKVGNGVIAIGNAMGYGQCMTVGYISALNRDVTFSDGYTRSFLQTDAAINPGNSGGGLFDMYGNLIGINSAKVSDETVEGMGYAIPITDAEEVINDLMNRATRVKVTDENKRASLGIKCSQNYQSLYEGSGAFVEEVVEDGAADKAGIMAYDIITAIDGVKITSWNELLTEMAYHEGGEKVKVKFQTLTVSGGRRAYTDKEVEVTLGFYKDMKTSED